MKTLIVTADDFGAAVEVNEAVERGHRDGILTATSLMVTGAAVDDAVARARLMPRLGVGLHLVLVDGVPVLPPRAVPDLVDTRGRFRDDMIRAGIAFFFRPAVRRQLGAEIAAQFEAFAATGLPLDHVDAHKHFHLHPTVARLIIEIGGRHRLGAARAPVEPHAILRRMGSSRRGNPVAAVWARATGRRFRRSGLVVPEAVFGLRWSGSMTGDRLRATIAHLPPGLSEVYLHPATGPYPGSAHGYDYAGELAGLLDPATRAALDRSGATLARLADLAATA